MKEILDSGLHAADSGVFVSETWIPDSSRWWDPGGGGKGTLGISGWGCAAGTLEPLAYTRATVVQLNFATLY